VAVAGCGTLGTVPPHRPGWRERRAGSNVDDVPYLVTSGVPVRVCEHGLALDIWRRSP
jgi:hypothetical protein